MPKMCIGYNQIHYFPPTCSPHPSLAHDLRIKQGMIVSGYSHVIKLHDFSQLGKICYSLFFYKIGTRWCFYFMKTNLYEVNIKV
jgi:hypothetical protein